MLMLMLMLMLILMLSLMLMLMLILIRLHDPHSIFPNIAIEKRVSPFGRLGCLGSILSILAP